MEARPGFKARLRNGDTLIGCHVTLPSPDVVELVARAGMDYVMLDLQHSSPDWQTLQHMVRAAEVGGAAPLVRVHEDDPALLLKVLELGVEGIHVPCVSGPAQVAAVLDAMYYPPVGHRSACGHTRAGRYNSRRREFGVHLRRQHERLVLWIALEDPDAITTIPQIAAMQPGADVIGVGRGDLSAILGHYGQVDHPEVVAATERVIRDVATLSQGRSASSIMIERSADIPVWLERGCRVFTFGADVIMLMEAARGAVEAFRAAQRTGAAHAAA